MARIIVANQPKLFHEHYETVEDWIARLDAPQSEGCGQSSTGPVKERFHGPGGTYSYAKRLLKDGWLDGAQEAEDRSSHLFMTRPFGARQKWQPSVAGAFPNVPAYLSGEPEGMWEMQEREGPQGIVELDLVVSNTYACDVAASAAKSRAVAYATLIDLLEAHGFRCRLRCQRSTVGSFGGVATYISTVDIKDYGERLPLADIAFLLGHPCSLRRIGFAIHERVEHKDVIYQTQGGYGRPIEYPERLRGEGTIVFRNLKARPDNRRTDAQHLDALFEQLPDDIRELIDTEEA